MLAALKTKGMQPKELQTSDLLLGVERRTDAMAAGASVEYGTEAITFAIDVVFALK